MGFCTLWIAFVAFLDVKVDVIVEHMIVFKIIVLTNGKI